MVTRRIYIYIHIILHVQEEAGSESGVRYVNSYEKYCLTSFFQKVVMGFNLFYKMTSSWTFPPVRHPVCVCIFVCMCMCLCAYLKCTAYSVYIC